jgi:hypothetical protein
MLARIVPIACSVFLLLASGCGDKASHENLDKWTSTKKGPGKLKQAFLDESLDPDLSAHAAINMLKKGRDAEVKRELEQMNQTRRTQVIGKLAPRLWDMARIEGEMQMPVPNQVIAKDTLVTIRRWADEASRAQIDAYLTDWYAVPSYEGRAQVGAVLGAAVLRMIGPPAGKKLMRVADGIIAAPGQETVRKRLGDELLLGMAATGNPEAVKYILDIARMDRGDDTLPTRAMSALYKAYVDPAGLFDLVPADALVPNLEELVKIVRDDRLPSGAANDAIQLIRVIGAPQCLVPLVSLIPHPHPNPAFRYALPDAALKCGGAKSVSEVVAAMPDLPYEQKSLEGSVVHYIAKLEPRGQVVAALRELLAGKRRVERWVAIESLAAMKSVEDAPRLAGLKSADKLVGFWGDQSGIEPKLRKPDPTLGQRAKELADQLSRGPN